jgi:hypothetical protein
MTTPRGIRNNNPGNLRYLKDWGWPGVVGVDSAKFAIFSTPEDGLAEFIRQLRRDQKRGLLSFAQLLPKYAPADDNNDVPAYILRVSEMTGIPADRPLNLNEPNELMRVMKAFTRHEQGKPPAGWDDDWYDDAVYRRAIEKAKPLSRSKTIGGAVGAATATVAGAVVEVATNNADTIAGAAGAAAGIWPKWAPVLAAIVTLCMIGVVIYARLQRTKPDVAKVGPVVEEDAP